MVEPTGTYVPANIARLGHHDRQARPPRQGSSFGPEDRRHRKHTNSVKFDTPPTEMKRCLVKLKRMVPTIERNKKVNQLELLQHVIDYIQDLEKTLQYPEDILTSVNVSKCSSPKEKLITQQNARRSQKFLWSEYNVL
ncbi:unnamed protein product [Schistosoma margrebowiei]|uniref:Uncharacterized protein n=1 Tax=Schistosoma margrebowiei TaxID=48269 RepID=A0A183LSX0_9TREM|nr:unnamed protein product [Schistosoma margrebowiei]